MDAQTIEKIKPIIAGIFMAEGSSIDYRRGMIEFTNTDPIYIKACVWYLENVVGIDKKKMSLRLRLHAKQNEKRCKKYWAELTGITRFNKTQTTLRSRRKHPNKMGVCWIRAYASKNLLRKHENFLNHYKSILLHC